MRPSLVVSFNGSGGSGTSSTSTSTPNNSPTTTSTTLPGCDSAATFPSIACRLVVLGRGSSSSSCRRRFVPVCSQLLQGRVMKNVQEARAICDPRGSCHRARARLGHAAHGLKNFVRRLNSLARTQSGRAIERQTLTRRERSARPSTASPRRLDGDAPSSRTRCPARERTEDVRELVEPPASKRPRRARRPHRRLPALGVLRSPITAHAAPRRERVDLHSGGHLAPTGESGPHPAPPGRGADGHIPGRGRHRAVRGRVRTVGPSSARPEELGPCEAARRLEVPASLA